MMRGIMGTIVVIGVIAVAFVLVQIGAFDGPSPSPSDSASQRPTVTPTSTPSTPPTPRPSSTPLDTSVSASANVVPIRSTDLATRISGVVDAIYVREGTDALSGQLLLKLDQSTYLTAIDAANDNVTAKLAAVQLAELQLEQLAPDASPGQIEFVQANLRLAEAELDLARTNLSGAQMALGQTEVRAPFAGTIADVDIEVGEQAVAGQTVISLGDLSEWLIETTNLSELQVVRLAVGDRAEITFEALPGVTIGGSVDRIQVRGTSDVGGVVFAVAIRPDEPNSDLRWGMTATVRIRPSG